MKFSNRGKILSIITQWLASDLIKELVKQLTCYSIQLKSLGLNSQLTPILYFLIGVKAIDLTIATGKSLQGGLKSTLENAKFILNSLLRAKDDSVYTILLSVEELPVRLIVLSPINFSKELENRVKYISQNTEVVIKQSLPLEFIVSSDGVNLKNIFVSSLGTFDATVKVSLEEFKEGMITIKVKNLNSGLKASFNLRLM